MRAAGGSLVLLAATLATAAASPAADAVPTLGRQWAPAQTGYGTVKPAKVNNGGDPTGMVWHVRWSGWGDHRAIGQGVGYFVWPGLGVADGTIAARAVVIAYDLGRCRGKLAYRRIGWYFPKYGGVFIRESSFNICSGGGAQGLPTHECGSVALRSWTGTARQIEASGLSCRQARRLVARSPSGRYVDHGGRFRYAGLFCGSEGKRVAGMPAVFECARGRIDFLYELTATHAARKPTSAERGAIEQAIYDYYIQTRVSPAHAQLRKIRISTHGSFARVDLFDSTASGPGSALLGYRRGSLPGWRVLDIGSATVGCLPATIFGGRKAAVLRDLGFECPSQFHPPAFAGCSKKPKIRPTSILVACGDGNFFVTSLEWSLWGNDAFGSGIGHQNDCRPDCADGHFHRYAVALRLFRPRTCANGRREFTRFTFRFVSRKPSGVARAGTLKSPFYRGAGCP